MAFATALHGARRLALVPAVAVLCLLAACHSSSSPVRAPASAPSGAIVPPAASPIAVTVAPASVAPGATRTGTPIAAIVSGAPTAPPLPQPPQARYVAPCLRSPSPTQIALQVTPGVGSAVVRWLRDGDGTVRSYRVTAISQRLVAGTQPAPPSVTVARGLGCGARSVSFSGLRHGSSYVFWLEEGIPDPAGGLHYWLVGQSTGVLVP